MFNAVKSKFMDWYRKYALIMSTYFILDSIKNFLYLKNINLYMHMYVYSTKNLGNIKDILIKRKLINFKNVQNEMSIF